MQLQQSIYWYILVCTGYILVYICIYYYILVNTMIYGHILLQPSIDSYIQECTPYTLVYTTDNGAAASLRPCCWRGHCVGAGCSGSVGGVVVWHILRRRGCISGRVVGFDALELEFGRQYQEEIGKWYQEEIGKWYFGNSVFKRAAIFEAHQYEIGWQWRKIYRRSL
jgi:hypothetical protein